MIGRTSMALCFALGILAGPGDGGVEVGDVDDVVAGQVLLGLGERPVARERLATADPHGRRGLVAVQRVAREHRTGGDELLGVRAVSLALGIGLRRAAFGCRLRVDVDEQHVLHRKPLSLRCRATRAVAFGTTTNGDRGFRPVRTRFLTVRVNRRRGLERERHQTMTSTDEGTGELR